MLQIVILFHSCPLYIDRPVCNYTQSVVVLEDCNALNGKHSEPHIYLNIYINSIFVVNMFCGIQQLLRNATYNHAFWGCWCRYFYNCLFALRATKATEATDIIHILLDRASKLGLREQFKGWKLLKFTHIGYYSALNDWQWSRHDRRHEQTQISWQRYYLSV